MKRERVCRSCDMSSRAGGVFFFAEKNEGEALWGIGCVKWTLATHPRLRFSFEIRICKDVAGLKQKNGMA